ncbi:MAG: putative flavin-nucleotide-binding protein [Herbinix sp.]|jgi:nitroimidazol reductase NimA-like FMN-containing flavoprotein (pyridoxamine 5'-phosphate oxidase superfamily)|nr:putative flavin-nucleotide-binding protein [Herbinix sp.]
MRRKNREVSNMEEIVEIIKKCDVCRIAFFDEEYPYIIPLNFGVNHDGEDIDFYFHGANAGKKLDLLRQNPKVGFELDCSHNLITGEAACDYTMEFESVCGDGIIEVLGDDQKIRALNILMQQYARDTTFEYSEQSLKAVTVLKLKVHHIMGKRLNKNS